MNTQKKSSTAWYKKAFACIGFLSLSLTPAHANESTPSLTVSTDYRAESSYYSTWNNGVLYDPRWNEWFQLGMGGQIAFSRNDFEYLQYKIEPTLIYKKLFEAHLRLSRKAFMPDTTNHTTGLLFFKLRTPELESFRFFTKVGWYYRAWELQQGNIFPFPSNVSFLDYDFAFALGIEYQPGSVFFGRLQAATFDDLDVYNLNHPYAEITGGIWLTDFWTLSTYARYQLLLGFGRMDRFVLGFTMDFVTDRYWD